MRTKSESSRRSRSKQSCKKLSSDKFTYLVSNELSTKYQKNGNVAQNWTSKKDLNNTSYNLCEKATEEYCKQKEEYQQRIKSLKKVCSKTLLKAKKRENLNQAEIENQVDKIQLMTQEMMEKAADIMLGRNNNIFSRDILVNDCNNLKKMGQNTLQKCMNKTINTRKTMLVKSSKFRKCEKMKKINQSANNQSLIIDTTNSSFQSSVIEETLKQEDAKTEKKVNLKKMIKDHSYTDVYYKQQRLAAKKSFGDFWKLGGEDKIVGYSDNNKKNIHKQQIKIKEPSNNQSVFNSEILEAFFSPSSKCKLDGSKKYQKRFQAIEQRYQIKETPFVS